MTTDRLVGLIEGFRWAPKGKIEIGASEIYYAATLAQMELLSQLRALEQTIQLVLPAGQETIQFTPQIPTAIAQAISGEVVLLIAGHPFNTGDEVVVAGVGVGADGRRIVTKIDSDSISLDDTDTVPTIGSTPRVYHAIIAATQIRDNGIVKVSDTSGSVTGYLTIVTRSDYEFRRADFINPSPTGEVHRFFQENTEPITLHVQGIPAVNILTKVSMFRKPLPCEDISPTVDPIIPDQLEKLMVFTTIRTALELSTEQGVEELHALWEKRQEKEYKRWEKILGRALVVREANNSEMRW